MPWLQTARQKEFEARIKQMGAELAKRFGMTRRRFFKTAGGMAAAFVRDERGVREDGRAVLPGGEERAQGPRARAGARRRPQGPIHHGHAHALPARGTPITASSRSANRSARAGWNPALAGKPQTIQDLMFPNYVKEIFLDSDTKVSCISGSYSEDEKFNFLTNDQKRDARDKVNKEAGTRRMYSHAIFTPGRPDNWLAKVEEETRA